MLLSRRRGAHLERDIESASVTLNGWLCCFAVGAFTYRSDAIFEAILINHQLGILAFVFSGICSLFSLLDGASFDGHGAPISSRWFDCFFDSSGEARVVPGLQMWKEHKDNSDTSVNKGNWTRLSLDARSCDLT